ncbi:MAG: phosphoserine phosphatase SerB [Betaproteobacteria bacterium]|nr:phosphoserine phosphatase SerB [Betaproteobacteria bacterium]
MMDNNLIIQAENLTPAALAAWREHTGEAFPPAVSPGLWRLPANAVPDADWVTQWCENAQLDCAWVPDARRPTDFGLLAMDMDSTLIAVECIDEIADMLGLKTEVSAITQSAMRGEIEFGESLTRRVALLEGLDAALLQRVYDERVRLTSGAEAMLAHARANGIRTLLVSGGFTFFTERLQQRLGLDHAAANQLEIVHGRLTGRVLGNILDAQGKAEWLLQTAGKLHLDASQTVAIGDGANDLVMMNAAGVSIAFHAKPVVRQQARHSIRFGGLDTVAALLGDRTRG